MEAIHARFRVVAAAMAIALVFSIPVLASYGLNVCPILLPLGFNFGCQYLALFAVNLIVLNALFLRRVARSVTKGEDGPAGPRLLAAPWRGAAASLAAYLVTVGELLLILMWRGVPLASRGPEVLAVMALLLATLQYYGTAWAVLPAGGDRGQAGGPVTRRRFWTTAALRVTVPALITAAIGSHFMVRSTSLAEILGSTSTNAGNAVGMVQVLGFLLCWQLAVMGFYAAAEVDFGRRAARHLQAVTALDFGHRSGTFGWGYWPELFRTMNQLSQGLLERSRLLRGFSTFVSNRVVDEVLRQDVMCGGKRAELTVLMADLRDFTALAETMKPEDVVRLLNLYFYAMIEELSREDVALDKFIGDGLLAYVEPEQELAGPEPECTRAVRAAMAMHQRLVRLNQELQALGLPALQLGIGIARGPLVQGNIGSHHRMQYTVIGDTVNLAARIEGLTKELQAGIVLDHPVWSALPASLQEAFEPRGIQTVRGRAEKIRVYTR